MRAFPILPLAFQLVRVDGRCIDFWTIGTCEPEWWHVLGLHCDDLAATDRSTMLGGESWRFERKVEGCILIDFIHCKRELEVASQAITMSIRGITRRCNHGVVRVCNYGSISPTRGLRPEI
ncbi:hypothetical protein BGY98DRAFT_952180 [Russula aff. rugulosa BPL654]|nr:hypothetical protein BGY98DRAFT_952180 [Russula aff. rugulosa BPL654]